jgi:hypothetical protein
MKRLVGTVLRPYFIMPYTVYNGSIVEYPAVYDRLHVVKYGRAYLTLAFLTRLYEY